MHNIIEIIKQDLEEQKKLLRQFERRIAKLNPRKGFYLVKNRSHGKEQFFICSRNNNRETRKYISKKEKKIVHEFQEYRFLKEAIKSCQHNIAILEKTLKSYLSISPADIANRLPSAYRNIDIANLSVLGISSSQEWLNECLAIKDKYPIYMPEALIHRASDGTLVRSKVECIILDILCDLRIPFVYELPIFINGEMYIPDFVCFDVNSGKIVIIEFFGLMSNPSYRAAAYHKIDTYMQAGYVVNYDFIPIFDDLDGNIDVMLIKRLIEARFRK